jgi:hypothetical protein
MPKRRSRRAHLCDIPAELPALPMSQAWHLRHDLDPAHQWLRAQIHAVGDEIA